MYATMSMVKLCQKFKKQMLKGTAMKRVITQDMINKFKKYLYDNEKSKSTVDKYMRDIKKFIVYADKREITKCLVLAYKKFLLKCGQYKISSINSFIVALNVFFDFMGWQDVKVKTMKLQQESFYPAEKCLTQEEYEKLVKAALKYGNERLAVIMETIASTGARISEIQYFTVSSVYKGMVEIQNKGKIRKILIGLSLQKLLINYIQKKGIIKGKIFCTATGKSIDRSNIWKEMRKICKRTNVKETKVFPHNLRHLFARKFYEIKNDMAKLADVLGHDSIETTRIYIKTSSEEHRKLLDLVGLVLNN